MATYDLLVKVEYPSRGFIPNFKITDIVYVKGKVDVYYDLPIVYGPDGVTPLKMDVTFDNVTQEFASFNPVTNQIVIRYFLLKNSHEGKHIATVSVTVGEGSAAVTFKQELVIIVSDIKQHPHPTPHPRKNPRCKATRCITPGG